MLPKISSFAAAAILIADVIASPISRDTVFGIVEREIPNTHRLHERHTSPLVHKWTKKEKVPRAVKLPMRIGLKQVNLTAGEKRLLEM
jgi:tripeptidyl-peptidase-1